MLAEKDENNRKERGRRKPRGQKGDGQKTGGKTQETKTGWRRIITKWDVIT